MHISTLYLHCRAAALGHFEAIQTLSAYGADFTLKTVAGENAMHFATKNYRLLCTRLLGQRGRNLSLVVRDRGGAGIGKTERERGGGRERERERERESQKRQRIKQRERGLLSNYISTQRML